MDKQLTHHGIKGMKWGVRRTDAQLARARGKGSFTNKFTSSVTKKNPKSEKPVKKSVKDMSDEELNQKLKRLRMEDEYRRLSSSDVAKGKSFVEKAIKTTATIATVSATAIAVYNNYAKVHNITKNGRKKPLPIVGEKLKADD